MKARLALILLALLAGCAKPIAPGTIELIYASPYSPGHPFSRADISWMKWVEARSKGRIHIRPIWSGALISSDQSMSELRHGVADIGLVTPIYARGGAHLIRIQTGFYSGVRTIEGQLALYRCMEPSSPAFASETAGLKVLALQGGTLPGIVTRTRPIRSLADLKGLRLRAPTELLSLLRDLGADPVNMPMGDVYSALAKGVIDGVIAPADTFKALHFAEVAHHYSTLSVPRGAYPSRAMGMTRWNSLPADVRATLQASIPVWEAMLAKEINGSAAEGMDIAHKAGVVVSPVSATEQARFDALYLGDARRSAAGLARYGIDGKAVFDAARRAVTTDGVSCGGQV